MKRGELSLQLILPHAGIVLVIGPSNSGKSTLLKNMVEKKNILSSEIISSDVFRVLVSDIEFINLCDRQKDEEDNLTDEYNSISKEAFDVMDSAIEARCRLNKLTFVDATHLHCDGRKRYISLARKNNVQIVSIVLEIPEEKLLIRDRQRKNPRGERRIKEQYQIFKREKSLIIKEEYDSIHLVKETKNLEFIRLTNPIIKDIQQGIDVIGDIHGCYEELILMLEKLGYKKNETGLYIHPDGRKFVSIGDVMSRGPHSLKTMILFYEHVQMDLAYMIDSNHGWKIARWLDGRTVTLKHGDERVEEEFKVFEKESGAVKALELKHKLKEFFLSAPSHYVFMKNGIQSLICTHAGIKDDFIGKQSQAISDFCRFGDTDGFDETGKPVRKDWFISHNKSSLIVWGHDPKPRPLLVNNTINIDQGVVFGGALTVYRYPEEEFVSVKSKKDYSGSIDNPLERKSSQVYP